MKIVVESQFDIGDKVKYYREDNNIYTIVDVVFDHDDMQFYYAFDTDKDNSVYFEGNLILVEKKKPAKKRAKKKKYKFLENLKIIE